MPLDRDQRRLGRLGGGRQGQEQQGFLRLQCGLGRVRGPDESRHHRPDEGRTQRPAERGVGGEPALDHGVYSRREPGGGKGRLVILDVFRPDASGDDLNRLPAERDGYGSLKWRARKRPPSTKIVRAIFGKLRSPLQMNVRDCSVMRKANSKGSLVLQPPAGFRTYRSDGVVTLSDGVLMAPDSRGLYRLDEAHVHLLARFVAQGWHAPRPEMPMSELERSGHKQILNADEILELAYTPLNDQLDLNPGA